AATRARRGRTIVGRRRLGCIENLQVPTDASGWVEPFRPVRASSACHDTAVEIVSLPFSPSLLAPALVATLALGLAGCSLLVPETRVPMPAEPVAEDDVDRRIWL